MRRHRCIALRRLCIGLLFLGACDGGLEDTGGRRDLGDGAMVDAAPRDGGPPDGGTTLDARIEPDAAPSDPCSDRPPLGLPFAFDMLYGNFRPTVMRFEGVTEWPDAFGAAFPDDTGIAKRIRTRRDELAVVAIDTSSVAATEGTFLTDNPQITPNLGSKLVSLSRCPGDFRPSDDPDCVRRLGATGNFNWGFVDARNLCAIERDQRYYLNILFSGDEGLPATWECTVAPEGAEDCTTLFNTLSE